MTAQEILLKFGEMSRSELRLAKAIVKYFENENCLLKQALSELGGSKYFEEWLKQEKLKI